MTSTRQTMTTLFRAGLFFMFTSCLLVAADVHAKAEIVPVEGVAYNVALSMQDNLKSLIGKKINVTLSSGKTFYGTLVKVGDHLIHLEKLDRKDFFDGLIRIDSISAIDVMFRNYKR